VNFFPALSALTATSAAFLAPSACSATDEQHDTLHPAAAPAAQVAQDQPDMPVSGVDQTKGMGGEPAMPGMGAQLETLRDARKDSGHDADDVGPHAGGSGAKVRGRP
jgi:hypothetical protein